MQPDRLLTEFDRQLVDPAGDAGEVSPAERGRSVGGGDGSAGAGGPYDATGIAAAQLRWSNLAGAEADGFPEGTPDPCTFPNGFGTAQNLLCAPEFVNEAADDYHLVADEGQSRSIDTGIDDPVGTNPTNDLENVNSRLIDFGTPGSNGNFSGNIADRGCYERP